MRMISSIIFISGKVQNVGFRSKMKEIADRLNVKGRVMNLYNGNIKAILEGDEDSVKKLIEWAQKGPASAEVKSIKVSPQPYEGKYSRFEILVLSYKKPWK